ncbi:hypothetical protein BGZ63DRAFT_379321 [Mariannaea sp. PMI_226]|nr:hypothetical protein BGZ63DRAFT_379321 [Mariannaea sp. PMI_226]
MRHDPSVSRMSWNPSTMADFKAPHCSALSTTSHKQASLDGSLYQVLSTMIEATNQQTLIIQLRLQVTLIHI